MKKLIYIGSILAIGLSVYLFLPEIKASIINPFHQKSLTASSYEKIETINIAQYRSTQYIYKSIFPYDYIYGIPNWGVLIYKDKAFLTEEDLHNIKFYNQCKDIGINLANNYFFIIKIRAIAGLDMSKYLSDPILSADEINKKLILKYPESEILTLEFIDTEKNKNHPDFNITPEQWQKLIGILEPKINSKIIDTGILAEASKANASFLENLFKTISWETVEFK